MGVTGVWSSPMRELSELTAQKRVKLQWFNTFSNLFFQLQLVQDVLLMQPQNMLFRYFLIVQCTSILNNIVLST